MNRAMRRLSNAFHRPGMRGPWQPFARILESDQPDLWFRQRERVGDLLAAHKNNIYIVQVYRRATTDGDALHLAVRRLDESDGISWDDLQRIKNEIAGADRIAVEMYPEDSEVVDQANLRHLFVLPAGTPAPFTIRGRWA